MATNPKRLPIDFNVQSPPLAVTNPDRAEAAEKGIPHDPNYPMHLVKPDLDGPGGPATRELAVVENVKDEKLKRAQGFMSHQEADVAERKAQGKAAPAARKRAKAPTAKKPANRKPKAPAESTN